MLLLHSISSVSARIFVSIALLLSVLFMPLWVSIILALVGMIYFSVYAEAVFLFLLSDLLYGTPETRFFGIIFASFIVAVLLLVITESLKRKLKFYP